MLTLNIIPGFRAILQRHFVLCTSRPSCGGTLASLSLFRSRGQRIRHHSEFSEETLCTRQPTDARRSIPARRWKSKTLEAASGDTPTPRSTFLPLDGDQKSLNAAEITVAKARCAVDGWTDISDKALNITMAQGAAAPQHTDGASEIDLAEIGKRRAEQSWKPVASINVSREALGKKGNV